MKIKVLYFTPKNEYGVVTNIGYSAEVNAQVAVVEEPQDSDMIKVKWLDKKANGQQDGLYFTSNFSDKPHTK